VKTRDGILIDPNNSEQKNMKLISLIENTFFDEEQATLFLNQPRELYCSSLVEFVEALRKQMVSLPEFQSLKQKILPDQISNTLLKSRIIICSIG